MKKIATTLLLGLGLLVGPTLTSTSVVGENTSARADDWGVGVRVYDRDYDWYGPRWRHRHFYRDHDDFVIKRRYYHRDWDWD
jgi:hypothetical protein